MTAAMITIFGAVKAQIADTMYASHKVYIAVRT